MIPIYLESSAFFKAYIPEKGSQNIEYVLSQLGKKFLGITSRWTLLELIHGVIKRKNLGEITSDEAIKITSFILDDINKLIRMQKLKVYEVTKRIAMGAIDLIIYRNLYAADAIHVKTAEISEARAIITDDRHIKRLSSIIDIKVISVEENKRKFVGKLEML